MPKFTAQIGNDTFDIEADDEAQLERVVAELSGQSPQQSPQQDLSRWERFKTGIGDVGMGLKQIDARLASASGVDELIGYDAKQEVDQQIREREADYQRRRGPDAGFDGMRTLGNVATALPLAFVPGANTVLGSAAIGGTAAAMQPVVDAEDFGVSKAKQFGVGALLSGLSTFGMNALARSFGAGAKPDPALEYFMQRGGTPTPGRAIGPRMAAVEERSASLPVIGDAIRSAQNRTLRDFNKMAMNEAIDPINVYRASVGDAPEVIAAVGRDGVNKTREVATNALNRAVQKMSFAPDEQFVSNMTQIRQAVQAMPDDMQRVFNAELKSALDDQLANGPVGGKTVQTIEQSLNKLARDYAKSPDPAQRNMLGRAFEGVYDVFDSALDRLNPVAREEYAAAKATYARWITIKNAAGSAGSKEGIFTPEALASGVRSADRSVGRWKWATGNAGPMQTMAEVGQSIVPRIPNSGTADRIAANVAGYGAVGAAAFTNPIGTAAAASTLLGYTPTGQKAMAALIAGQRPGGMVSAGQALRRIAGPFGLLTGGATTGGLGQ